MPEWSKGVDSSSTSASCVGSNPTAVILCKGDICSYISPQGRFRAFPHCSQNKKFCHCYMRGIFRNNGYMKYCGSVPIQFICLSQSLFCLALHAMKSKSASAGTRTRVTSMATMYSATRPLMRHQKCCILDALVTPTAAEDH